MKFYLLSPIGVPMNQVLFPMFRQYWNVVDDIESADVVLFDLHSRRFDYKEYDIDYILRNDVPVATFDEWDRGNMSSDEWPHPITKQQEYILRCAAKQIHFCRLWNKTQIAPINLYPYEKPISYEEPLLSPDELFNRELDIVYIANQSPSRDKIAQAVRDYGKLKYSIRMGQHKLPFNDFLNEHRRAKLFISSGAGGFTDERKQCLFSIAGLIQEETNQLTHHEWVHGYDCLKISSPPTKEELDIIYAIANDKELLYSIYLRCYNSMKEHYSASFISNYILEKIKEHLA